jgi:hypothetical protein
MYTLDDDLITSRLTETKGPSIHSYDFVSYNVSHLLANSMLLRLSCPILYPIYVNLHTMFGKHKIKVRI